MPGAGYNIPVSVSAPISTPVNQSNPVTIAFSSPGISTDASIFQPYNQTATAAAAEGNAAATSNTPSPFNFAGNPRPVPATAQDSPMTYLVYGLAAAVAFLLIQHFRKG